MLLELTLYFSLGFLAATLLTLLAAPTIWNRAVVLTRRRVENALLLTSNEISADKDRLRAEHAMRVRQLEWKIERMIDETSEQAVLLQEKENLISGMSRENLDNQKKISRLEKSMESLRTKLASRQQKAATISHLKRELELLQRAYNKLERESFGATGHPSGAADSRYVTSLENEVANLTDRLIKESSKVISLETQLTRHELGGSTSASNASGGRVKRREKKSGKSATSPVVEKSDASNKKELNNSQKLREKVLNYASVTARDDMEKKGTVKSERPTIKKRSSGKPADGSSSTKRSKSEKTPDPS